MSSLDPSGFTQTHFRRLIDYSRVLKACYLFSEEIRQSIGNFPSINGSFTELEWIDAIYRRGNSGPVDPVCPFTFTFMIIAVGLVILVSPAAMPVAMAVLSALLLYVPTFMI